MVYMFLRKKSAGSGIKSMSNQQLANELHKPIIRKKILKKTWRRLRRYVINKQIQQRN